WSTPVNMDFPINTPDDDILFIADTLNQTAYFASTRSSPKGTIDIYKIKVQQHAPENVLMKVLHLPTWVEHRQHLPLQLSTMKQIKRLVYTIPRTTMAAFL